MLLFLLIVIINRIFDYMHRRLFILANYKARDAQVTLTGSFVGPFRVNQTQPNSVELVVCITIDRTKPD